MRTPSCLRLMGTAHRGLAWVTLLAGVLLLGGCGDDDPSGPGAHTVRIEGAPVGAVVLQVSGEGVVGFSDRPGTTVLSNRLATLESSWRVVVVAETPGTPSFSIEVEDLAGPRPSVAVVEASDASGAQRGALGLTVRFE